jgi:hypothetical protein
MKYGLLILELIGSLFVLPPNAGAVSSYFSESCKKEQETFIMLGDGGSYSSYMRCLRAHGYVDQAPVAPPNKTGWSAGCKKEQDTFIMLGDGGSYSSYIRCKRAHGYVDQGSIASPFRNVSFSEGCTEEEAAYYWMRDAASYSSYVRCVNATDSALEAE